jgi:anti-anti-sigma regulatory factor
VAGSLKVIGLEGGCTIQRASQIKDQLETALASSGKILVNLSRVESIDVTFIQLLYAAKREAAHREVELHLTGTVAEEVAERFVTAGLCSDALTDAREIEEQLLDFQP